MITSVLRVVAVCTAFSNAQELNPRDGTFLRGKNVESSLTKASARQLGSSLNGDATEASRIDATAGDRRVVEDITLLVAPDVESLGGDPRASGPLLREKATEESLIAQAALLLELGLWATVSSSISL